MSPLAIAAFGGLLAILNTFILFIMQGIREDMREMRRTLERIREQVQSHESFIAAWRMSQSEGVRS